MEPQRGKNPLKGLSQVTEVAKLLAQFFPLALIPKFRSTTP